MLSDVAVPLCPVNDVSGDCTAERSARPEMVACNETSCPQENSTPVYVEKAIAQLSEASQQTLESLQETNRAVEQLDDAAQGLQGVVSQFKVQS